MDKDTLNITLITLLCAACLPPTTIRSSLIIIGITLCVVGVPVYADYNCLCNYRVETAMYGSPNENASPVGYMYEFDCKPTVSTNNLPDIWFAIMNEHLMTYVQKESGLQLQVCPGSIPDEDKLFTTTKPTTITTTTTTAKPTTITITPSSTTSSMKPTTTSTTTTTPKPTTTSTTTRTPKPTTTSTTTTTPKPTTTRTTTTTPKPTTTSTTSTTPKPTTISTTTTTPKPTTTSTTTTTPKPTTTTQQKTSPTNVKTKPTAKTTTAGWLTTSDWLIQWNITHSPYTTSKPHHATDWLTHRHQTHPPVTPKIPHHTTGWPVYWNTTHSPFTSEQPHFNHGNLKMCPGALTRSKDAKWLRQYKNHCYELVFNTKNWYNAEDDCWNRLSHGGELLEIYTEDIQQYIMNFLHEVGGHRNVWIGLQDIDREEHFAWDSGTRLTYSNWNPNRKGNHLPHQHEDCVMLQSNGLWDDSLCSHNDIRRRFLVSNSNNINVRRSYICQYPTHIPHHG